MTKQRVEVTVRNNGVKAKTLNRSILVVKTKPEFTTVIFRRLLEPNEDLTKSSACSGLRGTKIWQTELHLSEAAMEALHIALGVYLKANIKPCEG